MAADGGERTSLGTAALRNWWLVLLPIVLLVGAGVAVGLQRAPRYTAQSQLNVGSISARAQAVPGYVEATKSLASSYSRIGTTSSVLGPVARRLREPIGTVRANVVVTPVVSNPIINIRGTADSKQAAVALTSAMTDQLVTTVHELNSSSGQTSAELRAFRRASKRELDAQAKVDRLTAERAADPTSVSVSELRSAKSDLATAHLRAQTAADAYTSAQTAGNAASGIQVFEPARYISSDRMEKLQQLGFVGLAAGLVIGLALALARESRRRRHVR